MIPEPQRTYVLELLEALGPAADDFVVAGAQAMKFILGSARATKDIDFVLDVVALRGDSVSLAEKLRELGYKAVEGAQNFQFEKPIPNSNEMMRIEFMAPEEFKRGRDIRVDVQRGVHARACTGGSIALAESSLYELSGKLPNGSPFTASVRVTKPHALVMLKLLALDDRYRNIRGAEQARHDREEARTHAADVVAIVSAQPDLKRFKADFQQQFDRELRLGIRVLGILGSYFREDTSPGLLVYEEALVSNLPLDSDGRKDIRREVQRGHSLMRSLLPPKEYFELVGAVNDCCEWNSSPGLVGEFLNNLEQTRTNIGDATALERLPGTAFGGAFARGDKFTVNAAEASKALSEMELRLIRAHLRLCGHSLQESADLRDRFPHALARRDG